MTKFDSLRLCRLTLVPLALSFVSLVCWGCDSGSPTDGGGDSDVGPECTFNSDCEEWQICADGTCVSECVEDRDCPEEEYCAGEWGCWPDGKAPPQEGPPRDVSIGDGSSPIELTFLGCDLDLDCDFGEECVGGACEPVDPAASCEWSGEEFAVRRVLDADIRDGSLSRKPEHLAGIEAMETGLQFTIAGVSAGVVSAWSAPYIDLDHSVCEGVIGKADGAVQVAMRGGTPFVEWGTYNDLVTFESPGVISNTSRISRTELVCAHGGLTPLEGRSAKAFFCSELSQVILFIGNSVFGEKASIEGRWMSVASSADDVVITNGELDGVMWVDQGNEIEVIEAGYRGMAVHHRGNGVFGWFSTNGSAIFYSVGARGEWVTTPTGVFEPGAATADTRTLRAHVATNPSNGDPHVVFQSKLSLNEWTLASLAKQNEEWKHWSLNNPQYTKDWKAWWSGCGKPAFEYLVMEQTPDDSTDSSTGGWYFAEAL